VSDRAFGVGVGEGVGVGVDVGVPSTAPIGSPIAVGLVGAGFLIATPLLHTNFLPLLMQV
jgi:hypothetical protein